MSETANILLVDDEPGMLRYIRTLLEVDEHKVQTACTGEEAVERVQKGFHPDLVLLDLLMPGIDGLQTLEQLRKLKPGLKVVMLSCVNDTRKVVQAMRLGAVDYLTKPFQKAELDAVIGQCVGTAKGETYAGEVEELCDDVFFVAASPAMKKIRSQAALVANVEIPVLLLGESGTGKEVLARLIHKLSPRAHRTFLKVNCAAVPADLLESELFGYEAGAFTGATHPKPGKSAIKGPFCWMRSARCPRCCRRSFCMCCRTRPSHGSAAAQWLKSTSAFWPRPTLIFRKRWLPSVCVRIFTTA
jgi:two-component system response regulator AtoC